MKQNRHSLMAKGILVLLSLLILIFVIVFAWYNHEPEVDASGTKFSAQATGDFEYAIGFYNNGTGGDYKVTNFTKDSTALNFESLKVYDGDQNNCDGQDSGGYYHRYNLLHDYSPIDVTGDGATLIRPAMKYGNKEIDTSSNDYSIAEPNVQYISFDLYFRSKNSSVPIKLGNGSWAMGACELDGGTELQAFTDSSKAGTNGFNQSTYGNFSRDAIVGAVRIAMIPYNKNVTSSTFTTLASYQTNTPNYLADTASLLWLPKPELKLTDSGGLTGWTLSTSANDTPHTYYPIFETNNPNRKTVKNYADTVTTAMINEENQQFTSITSTVHIGEYYYSKVNVRIWVEGTDSESRRATSGGKFGVNFKFTTNE